MEQRWTIEYDNDTGPGDEGFAEWWNLLDDGEPVAKFYDERVASLVCDTLNREAGKSG